MAEDPLENDLQKIIDDSKQELNVEITQLNVTSVEVSTSSNDSPDSNSPDTPNSSNPNNGDTGNTGDNGNNLDNDEFYEPELGISSAYEQKKKQPTGGKTFGGGGGKAPDRGKWKSPSGGGKDVMEVFYNEIIAKFIDWLIKKAVDLPLDFLDYVLFDAYKAVKGIDTSDKDKVDRDKKNVMSHGAKLEKRYMNSRNFSVDMYNKAFKEVLDNIEKNKTGESLEWKMWRGGEPRFFRDLVALEEAARTNPNSREAQIWNNRILKSPEIFAGVCKNEMQYRTLALRLATFEEVLNGQPYELPKEVRKSIKHMAKAIENADNSDKMKEKMSKEIEKMRGIRTGDDYVDHSIAESLGKMETLLADPRADKKKLINGLKIMVEEMNDINPATVQIEQKAAEYHETISHNVDKIREAYSKPGDEARRKEEVAKYLNSIIENVNKTQKHVVSYQENGKIMRKAKDLTRDVGERIHLNLSLNRQKSLRGISEIKSAINDFDVDGTPVSQRGNVAPNSRRETPPLDRTAVLAALSQRLRVR